MRDEGGWLQRTCCQQLGDGAQDIDAKRRDLSDLDARRRGLGHPARDLEVDAVRPAHRDGKLEAPRNQHDLHLPPCEWMEPVVDRDFRRQGIVERCC